MKPECSYIIPAFRGGKWFTEAYKSAVSQNFYPIEILVGDYGMWFVPDDKRTRVVDVKGLDPTDTMNRMVAEAKSDIVMLLADDDVDLDNRAMMTFVGMDDADIFLASYSRMDADGRYLNDMLTEPFDYNKFTTVGQVLPIGAGGFRKSTCPKWDNRFLYLNDYMFFLESHHMGLKIKTSTDIVMKSRVHYNQLSGGSIEKDIARRKRRKK